MNEAVEHDTAIADTSFRPGSWFAVVGDRAAVFLPPAVKDRVAPLWELVDAGADFDELLDALIAGGLRTLPAFLILSRGEDAVRVLVRGTPRAVFRTASGDAVEVDGADATTWVERTVPAVVQSTLLLEEAGPDWTREPGHRHVVTAGLVRAGRVDHPPYLPAPAVVATAAEQPDQQAAWEPGPVAGPLGTAEPAPLLEPEPVPEPAAEAAPASSEPTPLEAEAAAAVGQIGFDLGNTQAFEAVPDEWDDAPDGHDPVPAPAVDPWPAPDPGSLPADLPPAPATGGAPVPPPLSVGQWDAEAPSDHDGQTMGSSWDAGQFARQQPGIPGQPPAPSVTARPVARLHFAHGEVVDVDRAVLVGRAPEARRFTSTDQPRLVTVPSPNQEISSTHLEVRPGSGADHGTAVVTDLGSTNGTVLVQPGLGPETLQPGVAVQLLPGALIDLGDGMSIQVSGV